MELLPLLGKTFDLALIIFGFGAIVFIHELGHFVAARWAGIRVLTFAVGLGNPLVCWRKGVGFTRRSSAIRYRAALADGDESVSPTEYRLNALPFGGYVKMLGQEDLNPGARSEEPDSYQNCPVWKRMIVLSAGVVFNVISAGIIFVIVFSMGISHSPPVIGALVPGGPAERAGMLPGDEILEIDDVAPDSFTRVAMKASMAGANHVMHIRADRRGETLEFDIKPERSPEIGLLDLGIYPSTSNVL
ncbi:MAG: site-2 protease family protein, partial [Phycisphaerales bacterium]|nr:site-2 protease family protein [Phycisphaerales bacterium]